MGLRQSSQVGWSYHLNKKNEPINEKRPIHPLKKTNQSTGWVGAITSCKLIDKSNQPTNKRSVTRHTNHQSTNHWNMPSQSTNQSLNRSIYLFINHGPTKRPIHQSTQLSTDQMTNQLMNRQANYPTSQPIKIPVTDISTGDIQITERVDIQSINPSTNQLPSLSINKQLNQPTMSIIS